MEVEQSISVVNLFHWVRFINKPVDSNTYIFYTSGSNEAIVVDPGDYQSEQVIDFLKVQKLVIRYVILTHEHFDHIWGIIRLAEAFDFEIICSEKCAQRISSEKGNLSLFYDQVGFVINGPTLTIESLDYLLRWNGFVFTFIHTPGHTDSSISFLVENCLLTGDFIIPKRKTITKLPTGNKKDLKRSCTLIEVFMNDVSFKILPGHDVPVDVNPIQFKQILNSIL